MNRRRGYSLIETLVVIATASAMLGIALGLLHLLLRSEQGFREEAGQRMATDRLADQFRRDVHAADQLTALSGPEGDSPRPAWQLSLGPGHVVEYRAEQRELARTERQDDNVLRQESFSLPADTVVSVDLLGEAAPGIVRLRIARSGVPSAPMRYGACIEAQLGKDHRFLKRQEP